MSVTWRTWHLGGLYTVNDRKETTMKPSIIKIQQSIGIPALIGGLVFGPCAVRAESIPNAAEDVRPLALGVEVPDVTLQSVDGNAFAFRAYAKKQPFVVVFYRGGWCPYCTRHLAELGTVEEQLRKMGLRIVAISPDRPEKLAASVTSHDLTYTLLSDSSMVAAKAFGVAFRVDDATVAQYKGYGIDLEAASGKRHHFLPVPAVFIVGTDGFIKYVYVNPDYKVRLDTDALLGAAKNALFAKMSTEEGTEEIAGAE